MGLSAITLAISLMFMRQIFGLIILFSLNACSSKDQTVRKNSSGPVVELLQPRKTEKLAANFNPYGFDTAYSISKEHQPFMVTGHFDTDSILDTALIIRRKSTGKDALFIKHGGTHKTYLLKSGKDVMGDFVDFNWIGQFEITKKGTWVWDNVIDGEIISGDQVPENKKFILKTDGIFMHVYEASGGGIIYFKNGKYHWVQQD